MALFARPKTRPIDRRAALRGVPEVRPGVRLANDERGQTVVHVPIPRGLTVFDRFRPPIIERKHILDDLGTFVMEQIDGRKTVEQIIDAFVAHHRLDPRDGELSTVAFIKLLMQRQIITVRQAEA